jgi:predicted anti-sigma-YlaC factor YlaD
MACEEIQTIIPHYITHNIEEEKVRAVEEHLCVCNSCRLFLSQHIDKPAQISEKRNSATTEDKVSGQNLQKKTAVFSRLLSLEYIILGIGAIILFLFIYFSIKS